MHLQPDLTMPHRTRSHWRILPPIRTEREPNVPLLRYSTNMTAYSIRMQNTLPPSTHPGHRKNPEHRISPGNGERNQKIGLIPEGLTSIQEEGRRNTERCKEQRGEKEELYETGGNRYRVSIDPPSPYTSQPAAHLLTHTQSPQQITFKTPPTLC